VGRYWRGAAKDSGFHFSPTGLILRGGFDDTRAVVGGVWHGLLARRQTVLLMTHALPACESAVRERRATPGARAVPAAERARATSLGASALLGTVDNPFNMVNRRGSKQCHARGTQSTPTPEIRGIRGRIASRLV